MEHVMEEDAVSIHEGGEKPCGTDAPTMDAHLLDPQDDHRPYCFWNHPPSDPTHHNNDTGTNRDAAAQAIPETGSSLPPWGYFCLQETPLLLELAATDPDTTKADADPWQRLLLANDDDEEGRRNPWITVEIAHKKEIPELRSDDNNKSTETVRPTKKLRQHRVGDLESEQPPMEHSTRSNNATTTTPATASSSSPWLVFGCYPSTTENPRSRWVLDLAGIPPFDGSACPRLHHHPDNDSSSSFQTNQSKSIDSNNPPRSDALALMGLIGLFPSIVQLQHCRLADIRPISSTWIDQEEVGEDGTAADKQQQPCCPMALLVHATLVVTVTFPNLHPSDILPTPQPEQQSAVVSRSPPTTPSKKRRRQVTEEEAAIAPDASVTARACILPPLTTPVSTSRARRVSRTSSSSDLPSTPTSPVHKKQQHRDVAAGPLHPALQLLLSLIRSDWDTLERQTQHMTVALVRQHMQGGGENYPPTSGALYQHCHNGEAEEHSVEVEDASSSFFPPQLQLGELYSRIPTTATAASTRAFCQTEEHWEDHHAQSDSDHYHHRLAHDTDLRPHAHDADSALLLDTTYQYQTCQPPPEQCPLVHILPILVTDRIARYLAAPSLHHLRASCRYMHQLLAAVVPGLRSHIRLYPHQVDSLQWMRAREIGSGQGNNRDNSTTFAEDNGTAGGGAVYRCICPASSGRRRDCPDGDFYRGVTGGQSVRLQTPPQWRWREQDESSSSSFYRSLHLDQRTGHQSECPALAECLARRYMNNNQNGAGEKQQQHDQQNMASFASIELPRQVARGGLLVDEPGLGKTITVLALLLQTFGLHSGFYKETKAKTRSKPSSDDSDQDDALSNDVIFHVYWNESVPSEFRRRDLLTLVNALAKCYPSGLPPPRALASRRTRSSPSSSLPPSPRRSTNPAELRRLTLYSVRAAAEANEYQDFFQFERAVEKALDEFANEDDSGSRDERKVLSESLLQKFRELVAAYKQKQLKSAARSLAKPNSKVAVILQAHRKQKFLESLQDSRGTLLVVPTNLLEHWKDQIAKHVDLHFLVERIDKWTKKEPLVLEWSSDGEKKVIKAKSRIAAGTHTPMIFYDEAPTKDLPDVEFLSLFPIVVTTTSRFKNEWKNGSFQDELKRATEDGASSSYYFSNTLTRNAACSLLKIHWLRMIIDEGHAMGRPAQNSTVQFASWISSERRWAMTGTPTKQDSQGMSQLVHLMDFLRHEFFTSRCEGDVHWRKGIMKPWNQGNLLGFFRLRSLLGVLMKRHTKHSVGLPAPVYQREVVPMSYAEVKTYNSLVTAAQMNIYLTSLKTDAMQDSLLHSSNRKHAAESLANIRRVCVGFSRMLPTLTDSFYKQTVDWGEALGFSKERLAAIREFMADAESDALTNCACCGIELSVLLIFPCCGLMMCSECVDPNSQVCVLCNTVFDVDHLQRLQPGFIFKWMDNLDLKKVGTAIAAATPPSLNANQPPSRAVRLSVGPIRPFPAAAAAAAESNGNGNLIVRPNGDLAARTRRRRKFGDGHICEYDRFAVDGKCVQCHTEHDACNLLRDDRCAICHKPARDCPPDESKAHYLIQKLLRLAKGDPVDDDHDIGGFQESLSAWRRTRRRDPHRPLKVIVFSQFRKALNLIGHRLLERFGPACIAEYWGKYRKQELGKFQNQHECFCMLLGKDGSEGLDLSFVTHIFFLEEIWDRSLADQAVARAWRMGAAGRVQVETLVAQHTVEETMAAYEKGTLALPSTDKETTGGSSSKTKSGSGREDKQQQQEAKTHALLRSLRLITDYHHNMAREEHRVGTVDEFRSQRLQDLQNNPDNFPHLSEPDWDQKPAALMKEDTTSVPDEPMPDQVHSSVPVATVRKTVSFAPTTTF